ncbi:MAG: cytidylyltransferase domain-containing protein [Spirochaetaceae bacterium]
MTAIFLQARLGSRRFPGKVLADLAGRPAVEHAMLALRRVPAERYVLLTDPQSERELASPASRAGFVVFAGDPEDVLARFAAAVEWYEPETVVRATGDNPLVSSHVATAALGLHHETAGDYTALIKSPVGTGVEVVRAGALLRAAAEAQDPYEREHVTPFLYRRPAEFRLCIEPVPVSWRAENARVTLDTREDYERIYQIYDTLYAGAPIDIGTLVTHLSEKTNLSGDAGMLRSSHIYSA